MVLRFALSATAIAMATSPAVAEDCIVAGTNVTLERVLVKPAGKGHDPLELALRDVPVKATIRRGGLTDLEVGGAIAFKATARDVWWTLAESVATPTSSSSSALERTWSASAPTVMPWSVMRSCTRWM